MLNAWWSTTARQDTCCKLSSKLSSTPWLFLLFWGQWTHAQLKSFLPSFLSCRHRALSRFSVLQAIEAGQIPGMRLGLWLVSEPDPRKIGRRVWHISWGGSVHCGMLGILLIAELCKACRVFCWTRHTYKRSIFPALCSQHYKTKQNTKTVLVRLAFPINAHQNANQKPIGSAPSYRAQCTLPPQP